MDTLLRVGKTTQFQNTTQQILPHLAPSSSPLSHLPLSLGNGRAGEFCALVIFSLGLPAAAATYSSSVAAPEPAWLCQSPAWPFFRAWILKIPASLKASGIWAPKHSLSHRMPPVKRTDLHLLMPFIITQSPWNRTIKSF